MAKLNAAARELLRDHGISARKWAQIQFDGDTWYGDACGCTDDRCIGYHHDAADECQCLPALLQNYYKDQAAAEEGRNVWTAHQRALESGAPEDRAQADRQAALWVEHYQGLGVTSWSLTETVEGRQGITITNRWNDRRWLVWDAEQAGA